MTEFEAATIALQESAIFVGYVQAGAALLVGLMQTILIGWGLHMMRTGNADRAKQSDALLTALARQGEALARQGEVLADIGAGIREESAGIRELLNRTR